VSLSIDSINSKQIVKTHIYLLPVNLNQSLDLISLITHCDVIGNHNSCIARSISQICDTLVCDSMSANGYLILSVLIGYSRIPWIQAIFNIRCYQIVESKKELHTVSSMLSLVKMYGSVRVVAVIVAPCNICFIASHYTVFSFQIGILHFSSSSSFP
jgi:hypothetical protein